MKGLFGVAMRVARAVGIAPYSGPEYNISRCLDLIGKIVISTICALYTITVIQSIIDAQHQLLTLDYTQNVSRMTVTIIAVLATFTAAERTMRMIPNMAELHQINLTLSHRWKISNKTYLLLLLHIMITSIMRIFDYVNFCLQSDTFIDVIVRTLKCTIYTVVTALETTLVVYVASVASTVKTLNENLEQMIDDRASRNVDGNDVQMKFSKVAWEEPDNAKVTRRITTAQSSRHDENSEKDVSCRIRQIATNYLKICDVVKTTVDIDGFLIILLVVYHALHIEINWHKNILWITIPNSDPYFLIVPSLRSFMHSIALIVAVETFHQIKIEMNKTLSTVNMLKCQSSDREEVRNELDLFLRMLLLTRQTWSPMDICTLDRQLLVKIFGLLVTYMVIIITYGTEKSHPSLLHVHKQSYM